MIMKTLQNNFTTPEQSKRLLELGVPADSADCFYDKDEVEIDEKEQPYIFPFNRKFSNYNDMFYLPCWSVGRLIEIFEICTRERFSREIDESTMQLKPLIEDVIAQIEKHLKMIYRRLDFSKLEE